MNIKTILNQATDAFAYATGIKQKTLTEFILERGKYYGNGTVIPHVNLLLENGEQESTDQQILDRFTGFVDKKVRRYNHTASLCTFLERETLSYPSVDSLNSIISDVGKKFPQLRVNREDTSPYFSNRPLVSVIIPTYNRAEHVLTAVKTVQNQSYPNIQTVVVIDGSTDNTRNTLYAYKDSLPEEKQLLFKIIDQENKGVSAARNEGIRQALGQLYAVLDDDDEWHPDKIQMQLREIQKYSDEIKIKMQASELQEYQEDAALLCTTDYTEINPRNGAKEVVNCNDCMTLEGQHRNGYFPPPSTWLFSKAAFEAVGGFDTQISAGEDADFLVGLRKTGATFINVAEPLANYTLPEEGKTYRNQQASAARSMEKHDAWRRKTLSPDQYSMVMDWYQSAMSPELFTQTIEKIAQNQTAGIPNPQPPSCV